MSRDYRNQQNQIWQTFQQSQPKFLTEDGIRQLIELYYQAITGPRTLKSIQILKNISKQWTLQIVDLNIKSRYQQEYVCFISDGFSKIPCLIIGQAANQIQFGLMKNYSIITIKDCYDFTIRQANHGKQLKSGSKLLVLKKCEVRCRRRALFRNIGDPMPYLQYKSNDYQNENGSLNIVKAQYMGTIAEAIANYSRASKEFPSIMVTVIQMPKSVYKDFLNIKIRDQRDDVIQASCFSKQVLKVLFQKIKLHHTYILREYEMRKNAKTKQLEIRLLQRESLILYEDSQYTAKKKKRQQKQVQQRNRLQMQAFFISFLQDYTNENSNQNSQLPQFQNKQPKQNDQPQIVNNHNNQRNNLIQDKEQKQVPEKNKVSKYQDPKNTSNNLRLIQPKNYRNNNLKKIRGNQPTQSLLQMYNAVEEYRKALQGRKESQIISIDKPQKYYNCQCFVQVKVKSLFYNGAKQRGHFFQILCKKCGKDEVFKSYSDNIHEQRNGKFICGRCGQDQLTFRWNMKAIVMDNQTSIDCGLQDEISQKFLQLSAKEGYNLYRTSRDSFAKLLRKLNYVYRYCKFMPKIVEQEHAVKVYYNILQIYSQETDKTLKNIHENVQKITLNLQQMKKYQKQQQQKITEGNKKNKELFEYDPQVWDVYNKYKRN